MNATSSTTFEFGSISIHLVNIYRLRAITFIGGLEFISYSILINIHDNYPNIYFDNRHKIVNIVYTGVDVYKI